MQKIKQNTNGGEFMIVKNQNITVTWNNFTKKHYIKLGYAFTKEHEEFIVSAEDLHSGSGLKINAECDCCHCVNNITKSTYTKQSKSYGGLYYCRLCARKILADKQRVEHAANAMDIFNDFCKIHGYIQISTSDDYVNSKTKLKYICNKHGMQETTIDTVKRGSACNLCGFESSSMKNRNSLTHVIYSVESKNGNKLLNPEDYINSNTANLIVKCGSCGDNFTTSLSSINASEGSCTNCGIKKSNESSLLSQTELINRFNTDDTVLINPSDYVGYGVKNMIFKCKKCGKHFKTSVGLYSSGSIYCKSCNNKSSVGELRIESFLLKNNVEHIREMTFEDCKDKRKLPFDFYIPSQNTIIEFDGQFHYKSIKGKEKLEYTQAHDKIKNDYCKDNNIRLIRIPYYKGNDLESILEEKIIGYKVS